MLSYYIQHIEGSQEADDILLGPFKTLKDTEKAAANLVSDFLDYDRHIDASDIQLKVLEVTNIYSVDLAETITVDIVMPKIKQTLEESSISAD